MNEELEKLLQELTESLEDEANTFSNWKGMLETDFSDEILTEDNGFEDRFKFLYDCNNLAYDEHDTMFEEAEKLISASDDEKKADYTEQLQALREKYKQNIDLYEVVHQDTQEKYSAMEADAEAALEDALDQFSNSLQETAQKIKDNPQLEAVMKNEIPEFDLNAASYNDNFWDTYNAVKTLKSALSSYEGIEPENRTKDIIACMSEEKKAAYNERLQALEAQRRKVVESYDHFYEVVDNKFKSMDKVRDLFDYRFNNIFRGAVDRFRTSDREVDEKKSSNEYKAMRTAINALVGEDGDAKKLDDPNAQKQLYKDAYDACSRYVAVKSSKLSKISHNGSRRLDAAKDMLTAITALYPEFEKSKSKTKKVDAKKEQEKAQKIKTNFKELSTKYRDREEKIHMKQVKAIKKIAKKIKKANGL